MINYFFLCPKFKGSRKKKKLEYNFLTIVFIQSPPSKLYSPDYFMIKIVQFQRSIFSKVDKMIYNSI